MQNSNIEIYIDRIVLDGFDHLNKAELNAAVQEHLMTMISNGGLPNGLMNSGYHRKLNGGEMKLNNQSKTSQIGGDIASGIFKGINNAE